MRRRLVLLSVLSVGATVVVASVIAYLSVQGELRRQVDDALTSQGGVIARVVPEAGVLPRRLPSPPPRQGEGPGSLQVISTAGAVLQRGGASALPVSSADRRVAARARGRLLRDVETGRGHFRVLTVGVPGVGAVQIGRSLEGVDSVLSRLRVILILLCVAGIAVAATLSRLFSRAVMRPVTDLTTAAEHIQKTGDLDKRLDVGADDEVGRMSASFNSMLDRLRTTHTALAESTQARKQLVADASHQLRTPVTSLRTNAEVLLEDPDMPALSRRALLADIVEQAGELSDLVTDLIELAREGESGGGFETIRLDHLADEVTSRARRQWPDLVFETRMEETIVEGLPDRLVSAVSNLIDNAAKYSPAGGRVVVTVAGNELAVADQGPGVPETELDHIFDRFWRGAGARSKPGSGLGLAIVKQVADSHGATIDADSTGPGLVMRMRFHAGG